MNGPLGQAVTVAIMVVGALGLFAVLVRQGLPRSTPELPVVVYRYRGTLRAFLAGSAIVLPALSTYIYRVYPPARETVSSLLAVHAALAILFAPLLWETGWYYLAFSSKGIRQRSPWRGVRELAWDDILEVDYSPVNMWFLIRTNAGRTIRVPSLVGDQRELLAMLESRVPASSMKNARAGYKRLGRPFPTLKDEPILEARPPHPR